MEQHAIPQQISSYEFKLVGEMTLKQFLKAAVGIVLALLVNATGLIFFLKYPLMVLFGGGGLALAFVPFQERPLDQWLIAFIKSVYSPTIYTYKKASSIDWLTVSDEFNRKVKDEEEKEEEIIPVKQEEKVKEFIESLPTVQKEDKKKKEEEIVIEDLKPADVPTKVVNSGEAMPETAVKDWRGEKAGLNLKTEQLGATGQAVFGNIPMPDKPDVPNVIVGMVTNIDEKIVEGAIVEIQDEKGNPNRVLKTNSLGQFRTTSPLANGRYLVITEKEGFKFDRVYVDLTGAIVDPIKIKAIMV
ncbi:MAG: PrgI family protein [Candidatus Shapirobacteria bacterium]|nr:PrgI family protein [Candidatus Shapirobacteria bacterium]